MAWLNWTKKNKGTPAALPKVQRQTALAPTSREAVLGQVGQGLAVTLIQVLRDNEIPAVVVGGYIAPRYISIGIQMHKGYSKCWNKIPWLMKPLEVESGVPNITTSTEDGIFYFQFPILDKQYQRRINRIDEGIWETDIVAVGGLGQTVRFLMDDVNVHTCVSGMTGSGKSVMIDSYLHAAVQTHSTNDLKVVLIDPHGDHYLFHDEEHLIFRAAVSVAEAKGVAEYLYDELQTRLQKPARSRAGLSKLLVVFDEGNSQDMLKDPDVFEPFKAMAKEGRKAKIHLLMGIHDPNYTEYKGIVDEMTNKMLGRVERPMASGQHGAGLNLHRLMSGGDFKYVAPGVEPIRVQGAYLPHSAGRYLKRKELPSSPKGGGSFGESRPVGRPAAQASPIVVSWMLAKGTVNVTEDLAKTAVGDWVKSSVYRASLEFSKSVESEWPKWANTSL